MKGLPMRKNKMKKKIMLVNIFFNKQLNNYYFFTYNIVRIHNYVFAPYSLTYSLCSVESEIFNK